MITRAVFTAYSMFRHFCCENEIYRLAAQRHRQTTTDRRQ